VGLTATWSSAPAQGADEKQTCLAAADAGQSLRDDGQFTIARDQFLTCARDVCPKIVHDQCAAWLRQLDEVTPTVVFTAKDERGTEVTAARVISDGKLITSTLDGKPYPLDPGAHDIRFERDPNGAVTVHVVLKNGEKNHEVAATFPALQGGETTPEGTETPPEGTAHGAAGTSFWNARNATSLSLLGAGAIAVGFGVYFGLHSQSESNKAQEITKTFQPDPNNSRTTACSSNPPQMGCTTLSDTRDAQNRDAVLSDVLYIAGAALAVGGAAAWLLWPKKEMETPASTAWLTPTIGPGRLGMGVNGAF
jgi:hypothetical protein